MSPSAAVPIAVVSSTRDPVETVNALLRRQGIAAHCTWIAVPGRLSDMLEGLHARLLLCVPAPGIELADVAALARLTAPQLPVLAVRPEISDAILAADLAAGACDTINLAQAQRAHHVLARELDGWRLRRACDEARQALQDSRRQLDSVLTRSNDAIIEVQEGILVEANRSWLEMTGAADPAAVTGQPVMDAFHHDSHVALKGALSACLKGHWKDHALTALAHTATGDTLSLELFLALGERDGEPCVRLIAPLRKRAVVQAMISSAPADAAQPAAAAKPAAAAPPSVPTLSAAAPAAPAAIKAASVTSLASPGSPDDPAAKYDGVWVKHIKAALAENRFRLVQQPITSLTGGAPMYDLLIRMLDRSRKEIRPAEFLPAAVRNNLMGPIDRWVFGAAARFAKEARPGCLFVRLSEPSALDPALSRWLTAQLGTIGADPQALCLTVTEAVASANLEAMQRLAQAVKSLGMRFALQHFGAGPDPLAVMQGLPLDFVKIDGGLTQGVRADSLVQSKVEALVEAARERGVETIAEHVEDANTMAVLWQLGVQHLEGFLIQTPEDVVLAERA